MNVWRYFADYLQFWLTQTAYPSNETGLSLDTHAGIDGLRGGFCPGAPSSMLGVYHQSDPDEKMGFYFHGGKPGRRRVTYRSSRHFDVLNDNLIYQLHHVTGSSGFKQVCDNERASYHSAVVLLNTSSQDEDNYKDPFQALMRFAVNSSMDGATMIFPGQELGLSGTIIPPSDSVASAGPPFGYERYESGFAGKPIPQFKTFNSMMPLWNKLNNTILSP